MKKSLIFSVITIPFILTSIATAADFRDLSWGDNLANIKGMKYIGRDFSYGGVELYIRSTDMLRLGGAKLDWIIYSFWNNRLLSVRILFRSSANYLALKDATFEKFGDGWKHDRSMESYAWLGPPTSILLEYSEITEKGGLIMSSDEITKQAEAFGKKEAEEVASKF